VAKAEITTADGLKIKVDGTPEEVAKILERARRGSGPTRSQKATKRTKDSREREGLPALLDALRDEKFFKTKRPLGDIRARLSELGHHYSSTTLGKQLLREVRGRGLRRLKEKGQWVYVQ
jgi:hypothetical protein